MMNINQPMYCPYCGRLKETIEISQRILKDCCQNVDCVAYVRPAGKFERAMPSIYVLKRDNKRR